jgi:hypothetical protein
VNAADLDGMEDPYEIRDHVGDQDMALGVRRTVSAPPEN